MLETLTLIMPGTRLADVKCSLETIISDLDLRIRYEDESPVNEDQPRGARVQEVQDQ